MCIGAQASFNSPEAKFHRSKEDAVNRRPSGVSTDLILGDRKLPLLLSSWTCSSYWRHGLDLKVSAPKNGKRGCHCHTMAGDGRLARYQTDLGLILFSPAGALIHVWAVIMRSCRPSFTLTLSLRSPTFRTVHKPESLPVILFTSLSGSRICLSDLNAAKREMGPALCHSGRHRRRTF